MKFNILLICLITFLNISNIYAQVEVDTFDKALWVDVEALNVIEGSSTSQSVWKKPQVKKAFHITDKRVTLREGVEKTSNYFIRRTTLNIARKSEDFFVKLICRDSYGNDVEVRFMRYVNTSGYLILITQGRSHDMFVVGKY